MPSKVKTQSQPPTAKERHRQHQQDEKAKEKAKATKGQKVHPKKPQAKSSGKMPGKGKRKAINVWAHYEPHLCTACDQTTHDLDRDYTRIGVDMFLQWTKTDTDADGERDPIGSECYKCFDARRSLFEPIPTQAALNAKRKTDETTDQLFVAGRRAKVRGEKIDEFKNRVDITKVTEKEKNFKKKPAGGHVSGIVAFHGGATSSVHQGR